jgi:hypothetical protein
MSLKAGLRITIHTVVSLNHICCEERLVVIDQILQRSPSAMDSTAGEGKPFTATPDSHLRIHSYLLNLKRMGQ